MIKVSVIVPVYNVEPYLCRCLDSLLNQTLKEVEFIIVVEKQCTDKSLDICNLYAEKDDRFKLVVNEKKGGLAHGRNVGLPYVTGEYIAFVDSDDFIKPNMYEVLYNKAITADADVVYCNYYRKTGNKEVLIMENKYDYEMVGREALDNLMLDFVCAPPEDSQDIIHTISVWHCLYSTKIIKDNGITFYDEVNIPSEDYSFQLDVLKACNKVLFVKDALYVYCNNPESLTQTFNLNMFDRFSIVYRLVDERLRIIDKNRERVNRLYLATGRMTMFRIMSRNDSMQRKMEHLNHICNSKMWELIKEYPIKNLSIYKRVIFRYTLLKDINTLYYLIFVYYYIKKISNRI